MDVALGGDGDGDDAECLLVVEVAALEDLVERAQDALAGRGVEGIALCGELEGLLGIGREELPEAFAWAWGLLVVGLLEGGGEGLPVEDVAEAEHDVAGLHLERAAEVVAAQEGVELGELGGVLGLVEDGDDGVGEIPAVDDVEGADEGVHAGGLDAHDELADGLVEEALAAGGVGDGLKALAVGRRAEDGLDVECELDLVVAVSFVAGGSDLVVEDPGKLAVEDVGLGVVADAAVAEGLDAVHYPSPALLGLVLGELDGDVVGEVPRGVCPDHGEARLEHCDHVEELVELEELALVLEAGGAHPQDVDGDGAEGPRGGDDEGEGRGDLADLGVADEAELLALAVEAGHEKPSGDGDGDGHA